MARTTQGKVKAALQSAGASAASDALDLAIEAATDMLLRAIADNACAQSYSPATRTLIATQLAAHFYTVNSGGQEIEKQTGPFRDRKQLPTLGKGLDGTTFGQAAKSLDSCGALAQAEQKGTAFNATFEWAGDDDYNETGWS